MRPLLHPTLVNGRSGDPALYVETLFEKRAILFDLGDISNLSPRKIHRLEHVFVSHAHIDHFIGFDRLLRVLVGREKTIRLYGPKGFIEHVQHKLLGYRWNLVDRYVSDLIFVVTEIDSFLETQTARFRLKNAFSVEAVGGGRSIEGVLYSEPTFRYRPRFWSIVPRVWDSRSRKPRMSTSGRTGLQNWGCRLDPGCANSSAR